MTRRLGAIAVICVGLSALPLGQVFPPGVPPPPRQTTPTFRTGVELVQVDVFVTDENDQPVTGLNADDFEVFENDRPQVIKAFTPVTIPFERSEPLPQGVETDVLTNAREPGHVYLFILGGTTGEMALRTRHLMRQFIDTHFGDNDVGAVITGRTYPGDRQDFTSNRRLLLAAVDRFQGEPLDVLEAADLMEMTARIPGSRKVVLWFGRPNLLDPFDYLDYRGGVLRSRYADAAHAAMSAATRGNIRIYLVDPEGLTTEFGGLEERMGYRAIAEATGGFAVVNTNEFSSHFERLVRETSTYYLLGFESTGPKLQGRYVRFEVKAKRPGLKAKSRTGYLEPLAYNTRTRPVVAPPGTPVEAALVHPMATRGIGMRVFAAAYKRSGRDATVALTVDVDASKLEFTEKNGSLSANLEIRHIATDVNHKIYPEYRHRASITLDAASYERVKASRIRVVSQFEVPDSRYQIRVASASGDERGGVVYDLEVPDFRDGPLALSGVTLAALLPSDMPTLRPGANRRSSQRAKQCRASACPPTVTFESLLTPWRRGARSDALILDDALPAAPTTAREFISDETLALYAEVYDNNARVDREAPYSTTLTATLRDASGSEVRQVSEARGSRATRRKSGGHGFTLRLPLEGLAAGQYALRVEARSGRDPAAVVSRGLPIRVLP
jgi:VWFA-related protein